MYTECQIFIKRASKRLICLHRKRTCKLTFKISEMQFTLDGRDIVIERDVVDDDRRRKTPSKATALPDDKRRYTTSRAIHADDKQVNATHQTVLCDDRRLYPTPRTVYSDKKRRHPKLPHPTISISSVTPPVTSGDAY